MNLKKIVIAATAFAVSLAPLSAQVLLQSDFSTKESSEKIFKKEKWMDFTQYSKGKFSLNCIIESGQECMRGRTLNVTLPETYTFKIDFVVKNRFGSNHVTIDVGNVKFVIRNITAYLPGPGKGQELACKQSFEIGKHAAYIFAVTKDRIKIFLNGVKCGDIPRGAYKGNSIRFNAYDVNMDVYNITLEAGDTTAKIDSPNLLFNSSFEKVTNGEYPEYWGTFHWGIHWHREFMANMDIFRKHYRLDRTVAYDGKNSIRIETRRWNDGVLKLVACHTAVPANTKRVFSIYAKASKPNSKIRISSCMNEKDYKDFTVGTEWTRCIYPYFGKGASERMQVNPLSANTVFHFDAAQLEVGTSATPYRPHQNELKTAPVKVPVFTPAMISQAPKLDGVLDETFWKQQKPIELKINKDPALPVKEKTLVRLACDSDNLYFAVECFCKDPSKLSAKVKKHKGPVWNDDAVEFFIRQGKNSRSYSQFAVNTINTRYEGAALADVAWNAYWETGVKVYKDRYIVEACIPIFSVCAGNVSDIYFNVGRENHVLKEYSSLSGPADSFLVQTNYPELRLPAMKTITASDMQLKYSKVNGNERTFICLVSSAVNKDEKLKATLTVNGIRKEIPFVAKKNGVTPLKIGGITFPPAKTVKIVLTLRGEKNKLWFTNTFGFRDQPCCKVVPEFSWFGAEKQFRFKLKNSALTQTANNAVWQLKQNGKVLSTGKIKSDSAETIFAIPAVKTPGDYELAVLLNGKVMASTPFIAAEKTARGARTNRFRCTFITSKNKELFLWSLHCEGLPAVMIKTLKEQGGFNHIILPVPTGKDIFETALKDCEKYDVYFTPSLAYNLKGTKPEALPWLAKCMNHPQFLFADTMDEFTGKDPNYPYAKDVAFVRKTCGKLTPINRNENDLGIMMRSDFSAYDVVSVDHYTIPERDISTVCKIVGSMREQNPDKPLFYFAQSCGNAYNYGREPTKEELISQVYQSFASEVWNVAFFANFPLCSFSFPTIKALKAERDEILLKDKFLDMAPVTVKSSSPAIVLTARRSGKKLIVVTANATREPVRAQFSFKGIAGIGDKFEKRTVKTNADGWLDDFKPLERHVYEITLK